MNSTPLNGFVDLIIDLNWKEMTDLYVVLVLHGLRPFLPLSCVVLKPRAQNVLGALLFVVEE